MADTNSEVVVEILDNGTTVRTSVAGHPKLTAVTHIDDAFSKLFARISSLDVTVNLGLELDVRTVFRDGSSLRTVIQPAAPDEQLKVAANLPLYDAEYSRWLATQLPQGFGSSLHADAYRIRLGDALLFVIPASRSLVTVPADEPNPHVIIKQTVARKWRARIENIDLDVHVPATILDDHALSDVLAENPLGMKSATEIRDALTAAESIGLMSKMLNWHAEQIEL